MPLFLSYQIKFLKFTFPPVFALLNLFFHIDLYQGYFSPTFFLFFSNLLI